MAKLNVKTVGFVAGMVWGGGVFLLGVLAMVFNFGTRFVLILSSMYIGYKITILGSIIGGLWGFVDACIGGVAVAWFYNKFAK